MDRQSWTTVYDNKDRPIEMVETASALSKVAQANIMPHGRTSVTLQHIRRQANEVFSCGKQVSGFKYLTHPDVNCLFVDVVS